MIYSKTCVNNGILYIALNSLILGMPLTIAAIAPRRKTRALWGHRFSREQVRV